MELSLTKEQKLLLLGLIASLVIGLGVTSYKHFFTPLENNEIKINSNLNKPTSIKIMVHICGAVRNEGVYQLKPGDRLLEALDLAGGALPNADLSSLNLAEIVKDGVKIIVPVKQTAVINIPLVSSSSAKKPTKEKRSSSPKQGPIVNLNTADEAALDSLPGIGKSTAKKIIEYRKSNGPFARIEQIMEIPKFGKSKFEKIKDRIRI
ncbi:MAG: ComEA family DNA-binding protein [bacterium]